MSDLEKTEDSEAMLRKAEIAERAAKLTWLKPCEAACYMNIGQSTLWRLLGEGIIPSSKSGGSVRIARTDIDEYWNQRKRGIFSNHKPALKTES